MVIMPGPAPLWMVWVAVMVVCAVSVVRSWWERRPDAAHRVDRIPRPVLGSAVTVTEIQRRLRREATRPVRKPRVVTVLPRARTSHPHTWRFTGTHQDTVVLDPIGHHDDE